MLFNVFHSHMLALISCLFAIEEQHESPHRRGLRGDICLSRLSPAYYWYWTSTWATRYWTHAKRWIEWKIKIPLGTRTLSCEYGVLVLLSSEALKSKRTLSSSDRLYPIYHLEGHTTRSSLSSNAISASQTCPNTLLAVEVMMDGLNSTAKECRNKKHRDCMMSSLHQRNRNPLILFLFLAPTLEHHDELIHGL